MEETLTKPTLAPVFSQKVSSRSSILKKLDSENLFQNLPEILKILFAIISFALLGFLTSVTHCREATTLKLKSVMILVAW